MLPRIFHRVLSITCVAAASFAATAHAVILLGTGEPSANTTAPTGELADSGWQFQGLFGDFLGTPIASHHFITATHVGGEPGSTFFFDSVLYNLIEARHDPYSDLTIWKVNGTFPTFAPIFSGSGETGQRLVAFGRGTQRGADVIRNASLRGWLWGGVDRVQRWGENFVTSIVHGGPLNDFVYATFDTGGSANEAHLSVGDSGGAIFIAEGGVWKLAGINYAVDGPYYADKQGNDGFDGALFDTRDFYYNDGANFQLITGATAVPSGFYCSRISSRAAWIYSVIDPDGDVNGNGVSNLVDYALSLNSAAPVGPGAPMAIRESGFFSIVYRKLVTANAPLYAVQQSTDLESWTTVTPTEIPLGTIGDVQTVQARVPATGERLLLRVVIGPPAP